LFTHCIISVTRLDKTREHTWQDIGRNFNIVYNEQNTAEREFGITFYVFYCKIITVKRRFQKDKYSLTNLSGIGQSTVNVRIRYSGFII